MPSECPPARSKSGYFVCQQHGLPALPEMCRPAQRPVEISQWDLVLQLTRTRSARDVIHLGPGVPDATANTLKPLRKLLSRVALHPDLRSLHYDELSGSAPLREQIARLMIDSGSHVAPEGVIITTGCHEALSIAIHALCQPGDIVAVDSPSFHGVTQILKGFGMKALEIPTAPSPASAWSVGWQAFLDSQGERWISRKPFTGAAYSDFTDSGLIAKK